MRCSSCGNVLRRFRKDPIGRPLALALAGLMLFLLAVEAPFMSLDMRGQIRDSTFTTGVALLDQQGLWELGLVVAVTTVVAPLLKLLCTIVVLGGMQINRPPRWLYIAFRWVEWLAPWSMIEVFLLGVFVAYSKLLDLAHIELGVAAYALGALMIRMAATDSALDRDAVWDELEARRLVARPGQLAAEVAHTVAEAGMGCACCGLVLRRDVPPHECPRCGSRLHSRKSNSVARTWALLIAAALLYIPANVLPVMTVISLGQGAPSTILSGVEELAASGMWPLAVLVFFASITVPMLKLIGLGYMLITVHRGSAGRLRDRTRLYRVVEAVGRWSMIDVFMLSVLVALVRLGFLASVSPGLGAVCFAAVVVLTMLAAMSFDPRLMWDAAERRPQPVTA
jgi:paraquat-inducible protein A